MILLKREEMEEGTKSNYSLEHRNNQKHINSHSYLQGLHLSTEEKDNLFWTGYSKLSLLLWAITQANAS